jgi:LDH2 family malate/lactate/ureidoglycolate dehydrogenase
MNIKEHPNYEKIRQHRETLDKEGLKEHNERLGDIVFVLEGFILREDKEYQELTQQIEELKRNQQCDASKHVELLELEGKRQRCKASRQGFEYDRSVYEYFTFLPVI